MKAKAAKIKSRNVAFNFDHFEKNKWKPCKNHWKTWQSQASMLKYTGAKVKC